MLRVSTYAEARVAQGARMLDGIRPGWENDINLNLLDMHCGHCCIAAQLYGEYAKARAVWFGDKPTNYDVSLAMIEMGFTTWSSDSVGWGSLQTAWVTEITNRRAYAVRRDLPAESTLGRRHAESERAEPCLLGMP